MLTEDGDCLLVFLADNAIYDVYKKLSLMEKWTPYMKDLDRFTSSLKSCENPRKKVEEYMLETGFKSYIVEVREKSVVYEGIHVMKGFFFLYNNSGIFIFFLLIYSQKTWQR